MPLAVVPARTISGASIADAPPGKIGHKALARCLSDVAAMAGEPLQIHGDGEQTRDYTYVDDAVAATLLAAIHPRAEGEVFNIGTGIETSVNALAAGVAAAVGRAVEIRHVDRRDIDNIRRRVVNIEKIRLMLRWSPQVALDRGLVETVRWFEESGLLSKSASSAAASCDDQPAPVGRSD